MPDGIAYIANKIPKSANLTAGRFISDNTIFPWLKPFLPYKRGESLHDALKYGNPNIYNIISFSKVITSPPRYLRYCSLCTEHDINQYGEAYWHRVHQLPRLHVCPEHKIFTIESEIQISGLYTEYISMPQINKNSEPLPDMNIIDQLSDLAMDAQWLLQNGSSLGYLEHTYALYDSWFRFKWLRSSGGKTSLKKLSRGLVNYYGNELLEMLNAYNSGACSWLRHITQNDYLFQNPIYHLLLMRMLAGSVAEFYEGVKGEMPVYQPYGDPPYPCRNTLCGYYLQDVIGSIEIINYKGYYRAIFECPHCGFIYRRKKPLPKEKQYSGQIDVVDYGWLWRDKLNDMLLAQVPIHEIGIVLKCGSRKVISVGIKLGLLPQSLAPKQRPYVAHPRVEASFDEKRERYRRRWIILTASHPEATRTDLRQIDHKANEWLRKNDAEWLEKNLPPSKNRSSKWVESDCENAEKIQKAMEQMRECPGKPKRISIMALGNSAGIPKINRVFTSGKAPMTKKALEDCAETLEQWQHRKIHWAIGQMLERSEAMTVQKVRHRATIQDKERKLDGFIAECILASKQNYD